MHVDGVVMLGAGLAGGHASVELRGEGAQAW